MMRPPVFVTAFATLLPQLLFTTFSSPSHNCCHGPLFVTADAPTVESYHGGGGIWNKVTKRMNNAANKLIIIIIVVVSAYFEELT